MALLQHNLLFMLLLLACSSVQIFGMDEDKLKKTQSSILNVNAASFVPHYMLSKSSLSSAAASPTHQTHQMPVPESSSPVQQHGQEVDSKLPQIQSRQQPAESSPMRVFEEPPYDNIPLILNKAKESRFLSWFNESQDNEGEQEIWQQKGSNDQTTEPLENSPKSPKKEFEKMGDQTEEITAQMPSHEDAGMGKKKANLSEKEVQKRKKGKWLRKKKPKFVAKQKVESDDPQNTGKSEGKDMPKNTEEGIDINPSQTAPEKAMPAEAAVAQGSSSLISNPDQKMQDETSTADDANLLIKLKEGDNLSAASAISSDVINDGVQRQESNENVAVKTSHQESNGNDALKTSHHDGKSNPQEASGEAAGDADIGGQQKLDKGMEELQLLDGGQETDKALKHATVEAVSSSSSSLMTAEALSPTNSQKQQQQRIPSNKEREKEAVDAILVEANEFKMFMDSFVEVESEVVKSEMRQCFHHLIHQLYTYWLQNSREKETRKSAVYTIDILNWLGVVQPERNAEVESAMLHVRLFLKRHSNIFFDFNGFTTAMQKLQEIVNDVQALFQNENGFKSPKMQSQFTEMTKFFELDVRSFLVSACDLNLVISNIGQPFAEDRMLTDLAAVFHLFRPHQKEKLEDSNAYPNQLEILRDYFMMEGGSQQEYMSRLAKTLGLSPDEVVGVAMQPHELDKKIGLTGIFKDGVNIIEKIQKEWEKQQKTTDNVEPQNNSQKGKGKAKSERRGGQSKSAKGKGKGIVIQEVPADCSPELADQFSVGLRWKQLADELLAKKLMKRLEQLRQLILTTNTLIHIQGREDAALRSGQDTSLFSQIWAWTYRDRYQHTTDKWIQKKALVDPLLNLGIVVEDKINKRKLKNLIEEMRNKARIHHFKKRWSAAMNRLHYEQSVANDDDDDAADDQAQISDDDNVQLGKTVFRLISPNYNYIHMIKAQVVQWTDETQTKMLRRCNGSFFYPSNGSGQFSIVWSKCKLEEPREYVSVCASFAESHSKEQQAGVRYPLKSICADFWKADNVKVVNDIYEGNVLIHIDYNHSKTAKLIMKVRKID